MIGIIKALAAFFAAIPPIVRLIETLVDEIHTIQKRKNEDELSKKNQKIDDWIDGRVDADGKPIGVPDGKVSGSGTTNAPS